MKPFVLSFSTFHHGEPTTFGAFIKKARLEKGLTQKELSEEIEVDEMTIVNWESEVDPVFRTTG